MLQYLQPVKTSLKKNNGLDVPSHFRPTVFEDPCFDGASSFTIRQYFNQWVATAPQKEHSMSPETGLPMDSGRYIFCIMVDEGSLQSVFYRPVDMDADNDERDHSAFVTLVSAYWYQDQMTVDDEEMDQYSAVYEPEVYNAVDGCTEWDVGCMRVPYNKVQLRGYVMINDMLDWQLHYRRVPEMGLFQ